MGDAGTTSVTPKPYGPQIAQYGNIWASAAPLSQKPFSYFAPGMNSYLPNRDPAYAQAIQQLTQRGAMGSPLTQPSLDLTRNTLSGGFLGSNPYLDATYDQSANALTRNYMRTTLPSIEARFGGAGQVNSPQYQSAMSNAQYGLGQGLGNMATSLYGGNYDAERQRMMQALGMAPQTAGMDVADINLLQQAGAENEAFAGARLGEQQAAWDYNQQAPWDALNRYASLLGSPMVGQKNSSRVGTLQTIGAIGKVFQPMAAGGAGAMGGGR